MRVSAVVLFISIWIVPSWTQKSDGCFKTYENYKVNCLEPYQSQNSATEQACKDFCKKNLPNCKAAQYDQNSKTCGLYNVALPVYGAAGRKRRESYTHPPKTYGSCPGYGPSVKPTPGFCYLVPAGYCTGGPVAPPPPSPPPPSPPPPPVITTTLAAPTTPQLPPEATCPTGKQLRYFSVDGYQLAGEPDFTTTTETEQGCRDACTNNRLPDGTFAPCRSADYNSQTKQCLISLGAFPPIGSKSAQQNANFKHYEKVCIDPTTGGKCQGPYFRAPQMILVGFAQAVANATSSEDCLQQCVEAQPRFGFECQSAMYYYMEQNSNCILNAETKNGHPDLFVSEPNDKVDYMEPGCGQQQAAKRSSPRMVRQTKRNRNILRPKSTEYGGWSMCDNKVLVHRRYKQCPGMNPNKCTKEEAKCDPSKETLYDVEIPSASTNGPAAPVSTSGPMQASTTARSSSTGSGTSTTAPPDNIDSSPPTDLPGDKLPPDEVSGGIEETLVTKIIINGVETGGSINSSHQHHHHEGHPHHPNFSRGTTMAWRHDFHGSTPTPSVNGKPKQVPAKVDACEPLLNSDGTKSCQSGLKVASDGKRYWCVPSKAECS